MSKALILVGGFGTRLRPLTLTTPKPCIPFANKELVIHQIEALQKVGVKEVILAVNYRPDDMARALAPWEDKLGVKLHYSHEVSPMGTAGPLALARELILKDSEDEPFFVLNSDVTSTFPFQELLDFHRSHKKEGTIMVTKVDEPSKYGVVVYDEKSGLIKRFVEKPQVFVGNKINAGLYIFNTSILNRIELRPTSIEQEIFPKMTEEGQLVAMELKGFWMDVGQPKDYLAGMCKYLQAEQKKVGDTHSLTESGQEYKLIQPVLIDPTASIGKGCVIGPFVTIGPNVIVEEGVRLRRTSIFSGVNIKSHSWIESSIIGWDCVIGRWVRVEGVSVLGRDVQLSDEIYINGGVVLDHKSIKETVPTPQIIM